MTQKQSGSSSRFGFRTGTQVSGPGVETVHDVYDRLHKDLADALPAQVWTLSLEERG